MRLCRPFGADGIARPDRPARQDDRHDAGLASDLKATVSYTWWPQRRGFIRNTLTAGKCDLVMGMPHGAPRVLTTPPYYRSTYVFVSRTDRHLTIRSLDDPALKKLRIGVQLVETTTPTPRRCTP